MVYKENNDLTLTAEQASNLINQDHLDDDKDSDNCNTDCKFEDQAGYGFMAVIEEHNKV